MHAITAPFEHPRFSGQPEVRWPRRHNEAADSYYRYLAPMRMAGVHADKVAHLDGGAGVLRRRGAELTRHSSTYLLRKAECSSSSRHRICLALRAALGRRVGPEPGQMAFRLGTPPVVTTRRDIIPLRSLTTCPGLPNRPRLTMPGTDP